MGIFIEKIKEKIDSFSKLFKRCLLLSLLVYLTAWSFTLYLSSVQKSLNIEPRLPVFERDSSEYANLAESLRESRGFVQDGQIETLRSPGYPFFVAVFGSIGGHFFVTFIQIILVFISGLLIREIGLRFASRRVGELAAILFIFHPAILVSSLVILTDILFLFFFIGGFYLTACLDKEKFVAKTILASLVFACAVYVRPMGIFALPVFIAPLLASKISIGDKFKAGVILVVTLLLLVSPWVMRNHVRTGVANFSSFKGINLALYAVPLYLSSEGRATAEEVIAAIEKESGIPQSQWRDIRASEKISSIAGRIILEYPFSYMKYHIISSASFLFSSSLQYARDTYLFALRKPYPFEPGAIQYLTAHKWKLFFESISRFWWKIGERMLLALVYLVALFGLWRERKKLLAWVFVLIPAYLMLLAGPAANARYAIQALPFIFLLFSSGFFAILSFLGLRTQIIDN